MTTVYDVARLAVVPTPTATPTATVPRVIGFVPDHIIHSAGAVLRGTVTRASCGCQHSRR